MREFLQQLAALDQAAQHKLNYEKTLALLTALKAGHVQLDDVQLVEGGWMMSEANPQEETPIAPDEPQEDSEETG